MRHLLLTALASTVLTSFALSADIESISSEHALAIAQKVTTALGSPSDAPFPSEVATDKAIGLKAGSAGALIIPEKKLTAETLTALSKDSAPLGQLWLHELVPFLQGEAAHPNQLRTIKLELTDRDDTVDAYFLGAAKTESGALELSVFAKDKTALVKVPLVKSGAPANTTPFALAAHRGENHTGTLEITVFGAYKAEVTLTSPAK